MAMTQAELDEFHQFASQRIACGQTDLTRQDLVVEWRSLRDREDINAAIREGIADVEAGRYRPAREAWEELRHKHGLAAEE